MWNWFTIALLGGFINSTNNMFMKKIADRADLTLVLAGAFFMSALVLLGMYVASGRAKAVWEPYLFFFMAIMGVIMALSFFLFGKAAALGPVSLVGPVFIVMLNIGTVVLGMLIFSEKISLTAATGIALSLVGAFMVAKG